MKHLLDTMPAAFPSPWTARAFALVSAAAEAGLFDLREFQQKLIEKIAARENGGECIGDETAYYDCWIDALTALVGERGVSAGLLAAAEEQVRERFATRHQRHDHDHEHDHHHHHHQQQHDHADHRSAPLVPRPIHVEHAR